LAWSGAKQRLRAFVIRQLLDAVREFAAAVVSVFLIAFGVFFVTDGSRRFESPLRRRNFSEGMIPARAWAASFPLEEVGRDFRIDLRKLPVHAL